MIGAINHIMLRLSSIFDDTDADGTRDAGETIDASYKYLGLGTVAVEDHSRPTSSSITIPPVTIR